MPMRSPTPSSPSDLFLLGAGPPLTVSAAPDDTAMDLLDVAWDSLRVDLHAPAAPSGVPESPASGVASPDAPSSPAELPVASAASSVAESPPADAGSPSIVPLIIASPHRNRAADPDEEKSDSDPYDVDELLAAAEYVLERPKLPEPPERHPSARWWNHFNPDASVNTRRNYPLKKLLDRWGTPPHVAYLVEWDVTPCQLSWEWPENLRSVVYLIHQVNQWRASGDPRSFNAYNRQYFRGAGASETGLCFLESVRVACFDLGHPDLVYGCHWTNFCTEYAKDLSNGVVRAVIAAFFEFLRRQQVCLDYDVLLPNQLDVTITDGKILGRFAQSLQSGHYLVHAAHDLVEHCFTLVVNAREPGKLLKKLEVLDGYGSDYNPPCYREVLLTLEWLSKVISIYRLVHKPYPAKKRRKTKTEKKREARSRMS
ncbi:hypothetical protein F442_01646 [Phytophthora nicotianae P10297]|uniref:Uncharacterized protein n=1 Tax=Phytophthora nicotianae P10297 TaxID=1317064 RepID=W3A1M8_PHYNI|nr:hypothetical protein F442_01646 [Phytophthora nicotianae P10297]